MATLYINDEYAFTIDDMEYFKGYLGVFAHEESIRVLGAKYEDITNTLRTEIVEETEPVVT